MTEKYPSRAERRKLWLKVRGWGLMSVMNVMSAMKGLALFALLSAAAFIVHEGGHMAVLGAAGIPFSVSLAEWPDFNIVLPPAFAVEDGPATILFIKAAVAAGIVLPMLMLGGLYRLRPGWAGPVMAAGALHIVGASWDVAHLFGLDWSAARCVDLGLYMAVAFLGLCVLSLWRRENPDIRTRQSVCRESRVVRSLSHL